MSWRLFASCVHSVANPPTTPELPVLGSASATAITKRRLRFIAHLQPCTSVRDTPPIPVDHACAAIPPAIAPHAALSRLRLACAPHVRLHRQTTAPLPQALARSSGDRSERRRSTAVSG